MRTLDDMIRQEVHYCVSALVSTLASGYGAVDGSRGAKAHGELSDLTEQAMDLACPIDDWEEAAREAGWQVINGKLVHDGVGPFHAGEATEDGWRDLCAANDIEPHQREVFEHWIVSDWLADKLAEKGEKVDKDFAGLTIWARTTTGQGIASDSVMEAIHADLVREYGE